MSTDEKIKKPFMKFDPVPQPHFIPGYTGFCPDLPRTVGASFGRVTNEILKTQPRMAGRLQPISTEMAHPASVAEKSNRNLESEKSLINSRFPKDGRRILNDYIPVGYGGHVPHNTEPVGVSFTKGCVSSVAQFVRDQAEVRSDDQ
ncbi:Protein FAM166B like protein [Argiope bruennichi]|uniref:Protein FAM166B like protein n=1 Tax=Argiope bruennichi TaxID=94029 RepID=A0A8T0E6K1_ARGBR|nr:Protein FAM166B like protein [Argiope bruennichi]